MSIAPYQQLSGEETRRLVKQNRDSGEAEAGYETEDKDEAIYFQHESPQKYQEHAQKLRDHALEIYTMSTPMETSDQVISAEEFKIKGEQEVLIEKSEAKSEAATEKSEFKIGNLTELTFSRAKVETVVTEEIQAETKTIAEQSPSSLAEFVGDIDFMKWGKKGLGAVFGFMKGLFGGMLNTVKESSKTEHKKSDAELKAEAKKKAQNAEKSAFYQRTEQAMAEARAASQNVISKVMVRLGVAGMGADMNAYLGENRNMNSEEINVYTAFEVARKAEEAKKKQEKQVKDMQMAEAQGPAVNIDAAVEGGTGGGKANMSAVSAGG